MNIEYINNYNDILDLINHYNCCFNPPLSTRINNMEEYVYKIYINAKTIIVKNEKNEISGFCSFYCNDINKHLGYITLIAVEEKYKSQGIGSCLIKNAEKSAINNKMKFMKLEVNKNNKIAISFYNKNGYVYDSDASSDTIYMKKKLNMENFNDENK